MQWQLLQSLAADESAMEAAFQAIWSCKEVNSSNGPLASMLGHAM
jgi:hypothetical protein